MKRTTYFLGFLLVACSGPSRSPIPVLDTTSMALADGDAAPPPGSSEEAAREPFRGGGDDLAYVVSSTAQFGVVNPETGDFRLLGNMPSVLSGLALGPKKVIYGLDADNNLVSVDPNGTNTVVGKTGLPVQADGNVTLITSLGEGRLFAVDPNNDLYSINRANGLATKVGSTGISVPDFNNCVTGNGLAGAEGHLYFTFEVDDNNPNSCATTAPSALYRINPHSGEATRVGPTGADAPIVGLGFIDDTLYGFTFGMPVNQRNKILAIDLETGKATFVNNQAADLDPVFGAIRAPRPRHHSRGQRED